MDTQALKTTGVERPNRDLLATGGGETFFITGGYLKMAGKIKQLIDSIVAQRAKGNPAVAKAVKAKFVLKGINPDSYSAGSPDDAGVITRLEGLARELGVSI